MNDSGGYTIDECKKACDGQKYISYGRLGEGKAESKAHGRCYCSNTCSKKTDNASYNIYEVTSPSPAKSGGFAGFASSLLFSSSGEFGSSASAKLIFLNIKNYSYLYYI